MEVRMKNKRIKPILLIIVCLSVFLGGVDLLPGENQGEIWPKRVLITNDNGIEDVKIVELARAFSRIAETYVVAPLEDRSGSTHYLTATQKGSLKVERRQIGKDIQAYAVDGFPADCVVLALTGIMKDNPPDLVISGINGGPNLGIDWLFSGTIGAARVASFAGFPSLAVSGLDDDMPEAVKAANHISQLASHVYPPKKLRVSVLRNEQNCLRGLFSPRLLVIILKVVRKYGELLGLKNWIILYRAIAIWRFIMKVTLLSFPWSAMSMTTNYCRT
jgi:hypothetical protein